MSFHLVPKSVALNDLARRNDRYFCVRAISPNSIASRAHCIKVVEDVVVKSSTSLSHLLMKSFLFSFTEVHVHALCENLCDVLKSNLQ